MRHYDYDEHDARDAAYDSRQDAIEAGECVCRGGLGPSDRIDGPDYWAESDCPQHGDDVDESEEDDEISEPDGPRCIRCCGLIVGTIWNRQCKPCFDDATSAYKREWELRYIPPDHPMLRGE